MLANRNSEYHIRPASGRAPDAAKAHRLVLTTTSLRNVVLADAADVLYYEAVTPRAPFVPGAAPCISTTRIARLDPNTRCFDHVAELDGRRGKEAKRVAGIRFYGAGEVRAVEDFLHVRPRPENGKGRHELSAWFASKDGHKYTWRADKRRLELTRDDAPDRPLVAFYKEKRYLHILRMSQHPYLELHPSVLDSLDYVVISFLLVERLRRDAGLD
ncbi:hypothetical protein BD413DRAFT_608628 [Trametes elegans]|nr:hypothetical protein BD413DRAFT_608628 [Trametes elegans]